MDRDQQMTKKPVQFPVGKGIRLSISILVRFLSSASTFAKYLDTMSGLILIQNCNGVSERFDGEKL